MTIIKGASLCKSKPHFTLLRPLLRVFLPCLYFLGVWQPHLYAIEKSVNERPIVNRMIIFGDSLSDTGGMLKMMRDFCPSRQSYWEGRFSDGFVWGDYLAQSYNSTIYDENIMLNMSVGGTTAYPYSGIAWFNFFKNIYKITEMPNRIQAAIMYDFRTLIANFESNFRFNENDLVLIWLGANDMLWVAATADASLDKQTIIRNAATYVGKNIRYLLSRGVKNIIVMGMLDFELVPRFWSKPEKSWEIPYFNKLLKEQIRMVQNEANHIYYADIDGFFKNFLIPTQAEFGYIDNFKKVDGKSFEKKILQFISPRDLKYLNFSIHNDGDSSSIFWDAVHPSTKTHAILAQMMKQDYIEPNFQVNARNYKCNYIEIDNNATRSLQVTYEGDPNICGSVGKVLSHNEHMVISIPDGEVVTISALIGGSTEIRVSNSDNRVYRQTASGYLFQAPVLRKITCSSSWQFNPRCE